MRQAKSSVALDYDDSAFMVAETPSEVVELVEKAIAAGQRFVQLTAGNQSEWNGRPIFLRADRIESIMPPMAPQEYPKQTLVEDMDDEDDED